MPWNDQSGGDPDNKGPKAGPWGNGGGNGGGNSPGGGPKTPWGDGGRGGGQPPGGPRRPGGEQPDLEEMMRRLQDRMRGGRRGGVGSGGEPGKAFGASGMFVLGALLVAGWFASGVFTVDTGEQAVVTRFGQFVGVRGPGLHVHLPAPIESHRIESLRQRQQTIGFRGRADVANESLMLTGDEAIVELDFTVTWQLNNIRDFLFNVRSEADDTGQNDLVHAVAESAMREVVGQTPLDQLISAERSAVEVRARELMQQMLDGYRAGIAVVRVQLQSATAPAQVIEAFNDVDRARQDAITQVNQATQFRNELIPKARGEAAQNLQAAEAYREQVVREARGQAERFNLIYEQYRRAPRVTRERLYLETMERVYGGADKIIIDGRSGVTPFLPLDQLRRGATQAQAPAPAGAAPGAGPSASGGQR